MESKSFFFHGSPRLAWLFFLVKGHVVLFQPEPYLVTA